MKRILILILSLVLICVAFASCGQGERGPQGEKGERGPQGLDGIQGIQGEKGEQGETGRGVERFEIVDGELIIYYTDGTSQNLGKLENSSQESEEATTELDFYPLDDGTYGVGGGTTTQLSNIVIPTLYKGAPVTKIVERGFAECKNLKSITIPNSVTTIGDRAFYSCTGLTRVDISDIGAWCNISFDGSSSNPLYYAKNLYLNGELVTDLVIPNSVTTIGDFAFWDCTGLTSVTIPNSVNSIGYGAFYNCTSLTIYCEATSKPSGWDSSWKPFDCPVVWNCKNNDMADNGKIYLVEDGVRYSIYEGKATVERQSTAITTSNIKEKISYKGNEYTVTTIGSSAFYHCKNLISVTIGDSVTTIGDYVFEGCTGLTSVTIGDSVTTIGKSAFESCTGLTSIVIPNNVTTIGDYAFRYCTSLTSVEIPNSVTTIGSSAFEGCTGLTSVTIGNKVTIIGNSAFYDCTELTSVTIGNEVTTIGSSAFASCIGLTSVVIPNSVTTIGNYAFDGCTNLTIYCEAESKPSGWESKWNYSDCPVYWYSESEPSTSGKYWHYVDGEVTIWE